MADWAAIPILATAMQEARDQNPRGDLYLTLPFDRLLAMLRQNVDELELALRYDNDVPDKCADVGNYVSFILHKHRRAGAPAGRADG